jgi:hypothetical protein
LPLVQAPAIIIAAATPKQSTPGSANTVPLVQTLVITVVAVAPEQSTTESTNTVPLVLTPATIVLATAPKQSNTNPTKKDANYVWGLRNRTRRDKCSDVYGFTDDASAISGPQPECKEVISFAKPPARESKETVKNPRAGVRGGRATQAYVKATLPAKKVVAPVAKAVAPIVKNASVAGTHARNKSNNSTASRYSNKSSSSRNSQISTSSSVSTIAIPTSPETPTITKIRLQFAGTEDLGKGWFLRHFNKFGKMIDVIVDVEKHSALVIFKRRQDAAKLVAALAADGGVIDKMSMTAKYV